MKKIFLYSTLLVILSVFGACQERVNPEFDMNDRGKLRIEFDNVVGAANMQLGGAQIYTNASGEQFNITMFNYFVSNIKLKTNDGREYVVPQDSSYFLIMESNRASQFVTLNNVPAGDYSEISFTIGVDSLRSTMDISRRTGVLDPANYSHDTGGMYWSWNSGYIFVRMEGTSPQAPADAAGNRRFRYHIGLFGGYNNPTINNVKSITRTFNGDLAKVRKDRTPEVHFVVDALKVFDGPAHRLSIAANSAVMASPFSANIANNYVEMFKYDHLHN
jgi:hypothetical protein